MIRKTTLALAATLAVAGAAIAQGGGHSGHAGHAGHGAPVAGDPAVAAKFQAANDRMHRDMGVKLTGDADRDFAAGMIPHHQGAIDMAKIVLEHGRDPELRKLAEDIVAAQEKEIAQLRAWLQRNP